MKRKLPTQKKPRKEAPVKTGASVSTSPSRSKAQAAQTPIVLPAEDDEALESSALDPDQEIEAEIASAHAEDHPEKDEPQALAPRSDSDFEVAPSEEGELSPGSRALSVSDPLRRYMEEVKRYPLLSPEDEFKLAQRMRESGDMNAAKALVSANLRLVVKIAYEYRSYTTNLLDLIQEGNVGLMKAVSKFDPIKGARLGYYASWWIRSYILKYLLENFRLVRLGTTQSQKKLFYHLMREKERLEAQGLAAGPKLLADRLNVREKDIIEMEQRLSHHGGEVSLDAPVGGDGDGGEGRAQSHVDLLVDEQEMPLDALEREELLQLLAERLPAFAAKLNEREKRIFHDRLLAEEPKTLQEIADVYGLTRERARQIEARMIEKLREFLKDDLGE
jgi:RNA polymerase sigma-32 factor